MDEQPIQKDRDDQPVDKKHFQPDDESSKVDEEPLHSPDDEPVDTQPVLPSHEIMDKPVLPNPEPVDAQSSQRSSSASLSEPTSDSSTLPGVTKPYRRSIKKEGLQSRRADSGSLSTTSLESYLRLTDNDEFFIKLNA